MLLPSLDWEDPLEEGWQSTLVFLPGEFHGQRSLAGYSPWGCKESDATEVTEHPRDLPWGGGLSWPWGMWDLSSSARD